MRVISHMMGWIFCIIVIVGYGFKEAFFAYTLFFLLVVTDGFTVEDWSNAWRKISSQIKR